jgi:energy-coupling factor transport system ATP-binding protein
MITISNLSFGYTRKNVILHNISLTFGQGETILIAGPNGSGKSTLLKALLGVIPLHTGGAISGRVSYDDKDITSFNIVQLTGKIGLVLQDPSSQISNLDVLEEAAFGSCNMLAPRETALAVAREALNMVGLGHKVDASVFNLSGGELQRLAIASIVALKPKVIILDEPLSNLDPMGVASVIEVLRELGKYIETIIITTHWLDPFMEIATRLILMKKGSVSLDVPIKDVGSHKHELTEAYVEIPHKLLIEDLLSKKGMTLQSCLGIKPLVNTTTLTNNPLITATSLGFNYNNGPKTLHDLSFAIEKHSKVALLGHNGCGKTTLASVLTGIKKATSGKIASLSKRPYLILQKPSLGFIATTVKEELSYGLTMSPETIEKILREFGLWEYRNTSPFLLSGGEQRRLSLATSFAHNPDFIVFEEPTAGIDASQIQTFREALRKYAGTALVITHDTRLVGSDLRQAIVLARGTMRFKGSTADMSKLLLQELGFDKVNSTIAFGFNYLESGFPMSPEELEVRP